MATALGTLALPGFRHLAFSYLINELGDWLGSVALAVLVFDQTGSALATAALFLSAQFLPALFVPALVARLELLPARRSLPLLYAGEAAAFIGLGAIAADFTLAGVIALAAVDGAFGGSARALTRATAGAILAPRGLLREGNAILNVGFTTGAAVGPAVGGLLVAQAGVEVALFADAGSFLIVAGALSAARHLPQPEPGAPGWADRLRRGLDYVRRRPALTLLLGSEAAAFVFFAAVIPVEVVFAKATLDAGDAGYGALLASWGAGMVAGSMIFTVIRQHSLRLLIALSTAGIGLAYLGTAVAPSLLVACVASVIGGAGNGVQWVALISALQELARPAYHARVLALLESAASAMPGVGFLLGGAVASALSARASFAVAGAGVFAVLAAASLVARRVAWESDPLAPAPAASEPGPPRLRA